MTIKKKRDLNKHEQEYDDWIKSCSSSLADLRLERQSIISLLKEKDKNNINFVFGDEKQIALSTK